MLLSNDEKEGEEDDIASIPIYIEDVMQRALKFGFEPSPHPHGTPATPFSFFAISAVALPRLPTFHTLSNTLSALCFVLGLIDSLTF